MGVNIARVTLHVGLGTFRPVKVENILDHHMHSEFYVVTQEAADMINNTRKNGGRVLLLEQQAQELLSQSHLKMEQFQQRVDGQRYSYIRDISSRQSIVL